MMRDVVLNTGRRLAALAFMAVAAGLLSGCAVASHDGQVVVAAHHARAYPDIRNDGPPG